MSVTMILAVAITSVKTTGDINVAEGESALVVPKSV